MDDAFQEWQEQNPDQAKRFHETQRETAETNRRVLGGEVLSPEELADLAPRGYFSPDTARNARNNLLSVTTSTLSDIAIIEPGVPFSAISDKPQRTTDSKSLLFHAQDRWSQDKPSSNPLINDLCRCYIGACLIHKTSHKYVPRDIVPNNGHGRRSCDYH